MKGVDFSWARPGGAAIRAAGYQFVVRYVPYLGDGGKGLTAAEVADYRANGLGLGLVFEQTDGRIFEGYNAGGQDALTSSVAATRLGFPGDQIIFFACDKDTTAATVEAIRPYLQGAIDVIGLERVGIYGEFDVIEFCLANHLASCFWQTYAWSGGAVHASRDLYQYLNGQEVGGGAVDLCESYGADRGLWKVEEEEMGLTAEERIELDAFKRAVFAGKEQPGTDAERTAYANFKINEGSQSVNDTAQSAIVVALGSSGAVQPGMKPDEVQAIIDRELSKARIIVTGG